MLHILLGPSGVGKSTLIDALVREHGWRALPVYTTRQASRAIDQKVRITASEFERLQSDGRFHAVQATYGARYGQLKVDVEAARTQACNWIFDLAAAFAEPYQSMARLYLVLPTSREQLVLHLERSGRHDRIRDAVEDYQATLASASEFGAKEIPVVFIEFGNVGKAVSTMIAASQA